ncbi:MAG TPA: hypothetical protein VFJ16_04330 [Longimicrobium sp.]|nr:hypothetical protein [Longimicrobium sp.]
MSTLAPPALTFRRRSTMERLVLDPALEIGTGGEAVVYEVPDDAALVAKIYHQPTIERARKLTLMLAHPPRMPEGTAIAWPADLLLHPGGFAGFLMPRADGPRLFEFYNPVTRRSTAPAFHFGLLHRAGRNLAEAFDALHAAGYVVGDVNESNILVDPRTAAVTLVDADSFQVHDTDAGTVFRSRVGKAEFTPPELQGVSFTDVDRAAAHDRFGLAVLLFLLLMEGTHPFAVRMHPGADALPVEERIRLGLFPHAREDDDIHPPRLSPRFAALHPGVRALFVRCFVDGHADPSARPLPAEWAGALEAAGAELAECARNELHRHDPRLDACPWCERAELLGGRDPFPAGAERIPARPRPRRARVAAAFDPAGTPNATMTAAQFGVRPPFQLLKGMAGPVPARASGPPAPAVFGPSGLQNPLVYVMSGVMVALVGHGFPALAGVVVAFGALARLVLMDTWKNVRASTVALAVCLALFVGAMAGLGFGDDGYADDSISGTYGGTPYGSGALPTGQPSVADPSVAPALPGQPGNAEATGGRSMMDVLLADLHSTPVSEGVEDPGPPLEPGEAGELVDGDRVERLPSLDNEREAARALAWFARENAPDGARADSVMLWLHVSAGGQVTAEGRQLIRSTSSAAAAAAIAAVPYLHYRPAMYKGHAVGTWVTQRLVIDP